MFGIIIGSILVLLGLQILFHKVLRIKLPLLQAGIAILLIIGGITMIFNPSAYKALKYKTITSTDKNGHVTTKRWYFDDQL